jgi:hypothetical protein
MPAPRLLCYPAAAALWTRDRFTAKNLPPAAREVRRENGFVAAFDDFWQCLAARRSTLLGVRSCDVLEWHFGASLRREEVWVLTVPDGERLAGYAIFQRRDEPATGLRRMRLVDFQALSDERDCLNALLSEALRMAQRESIDVLEKVGRNLEDTRLIDEFAPYRRKLPAWPMFFHTPDAELHHQLQRPEVWNPSSFDGDSSL